MNLELLKKCITNSPYTHNELAEEVGITIATWYRKFKKGNFTVDEFLIIAKVLNLSKDQILNILNLD